LESVYALLDLHLGSPKVGSCWIDQNVYYPLNVVMIGFRRKLVRNDRRDIAQQDRLFVAVVVRNMMHWNVTQRLDRVDRLLAILRCQKIVIARFSVDPDRR